MKVTLTQGQWTQVVVTDSDTVLQAEGSWLFSTEDPSGDSFAGPILIPEYAAVTVSAGKTVWAYPRNFNYGRSLSINYQKVSI